MKAIKTFRDLLAFLTVIPLGKTDDFVVTSAEAIFLFPVIGGFIGLLGAAYFVGCGFLMSYLLAFIDSIIQIPVEFLLKLAPAVMTFAFLLVLTGLQHFDGLVDLGNTIGLGSVKERRAAAHAWTVSYKGALLAIFVEFFAVSGLFFINGEFAFGAIIAAEVVAKLSMVTIAWLGKPTHTGLGSIFLETARRKRNIVAYFLAVLIVTDPARQTMPVGIALFQGEHTVPWGEIAAASLIATLPLVIMVLFFQRRIVSGLCAGAVKG